MPDKSLNKINELLNEEKWTRAAINSYTINNFKELDLVIEQAKQSDNKSILSEAKELCAEHLTHTKNSIIALYISGIIALNHQLIDDSNLIFLISILLITINGILLNICAIRYLNSVKIKWH